MCTLHERRHQVIPSVWVVDPQPRRQRRTHVAAAHVRRVRYNDRVARRQVLSLPNDLGGPVESIGAEDIALVVERREVVSEPCSQVWIELYERSEGVGFGELVPENLDRKSTRLNSSH